MRRWASTCRLPTPVIPPERTIPRLRRKMPTAIPSFLAEGTSLFGIVVGIALILAGLGFVILALGGALRNRSAEAK